MTNALPYYKFEANAWLTGKIQLCTSEEKGIFIDLLARIWVNGGTLPITKILPRQLNVPQGTLTDAIGTFTDLEIMECNEDVLRVKFIDDQLKARGAFLKSCSEAGKKSAQKRKQSKVPQAREEKRREESIIEEKITEKKETKTAPVKRFIKPTVEEVAAYIIEKGYTFDAETFIAFYESNGWKVGRNQMKSWQSTCVTWGKRKSFKQGNNNRPAHLDTPTDYSGCLDESEKVMREGF